MTHGAPKSVTALLGELSGGREDAFGALVAAVYDDLHAIAEGRLRRRYGERLEAMTITPTVLADDAVMALMRQRAEWANREQFFAIATRLMLRLISDYQRARSALKRGGGHRGSPAPSVDPQAPSVDVTGAEDWGPEVLDAVTRLEEQHPRKAEVVTLHVIAGWPMPRVAERLGVSLPTVERDWRFAKAWLASELRGIDDA